MTFKLPVPDIIGYWFGDALQSQPALQAQAPLWYSGSAEIDREIIQRFGHLFEPAASHYGQIPEWEALPCDELLAAVILFDQFSRNCFRKTAKAFDFDHLALDILDVAVRRKCDTSLHPLHCIFLYMPLQHSESLARQSQGVALFERLLQRTESFAESQVAGSLRFAHLHRDIIADYGRFPHRNSVLGRESTPAERAYLADGGKRFGQ